MKLNRNDYAIEATTDGGYYAYLKVISCAVRTVKHLMKPARTLLTLLTTSSQICTWLKSLYNMCSIP